MQQILPEQLAHRDRHQLLLSGVAPRPIALLATTSVSGVNNVSPYSFFNAFASRPPVLALGPAVSSRTGKHKDSWQNLMDTKECTVNVCSYSMVHAINLASCEYEPDVDEFAMSGLTAAQSTIVKAPRVGESLYSMECVLLQNIELERGRGGNGNLTLVEVVNFWVNPGIMVEGSVKPYSMDLIARMGYDYYSRVTPDVIFEVPKLPFNAVGVINLPGAIREWSGFTLNQRAQLASVAALPQHHEHVTREHIERCFSAVVEYLELNDVESAWELLCRREA
jgi:flavin reductase (DIM6/NTAB) family NADH-FMN oxidoreductase RutF